MSIIILCDRCQQSCQKEPSSGYVTVNEYAEFTARWGYFSKRDMEQWEYVLCEDCATLVYKWIKKEDEKLTD